MKCNALIYISCHWNREKCSHPYSFPPLFSTTSYGYAVYKISFFKWDSTQHLFTCKVDGVVYHPMVQTQLRYHVALQVAYVSCVWQTRTKPKSTIESCVFMGDSRWIRLLFDRVLVFTWAIGKNALTIHINCSPQRRQKFGHHEPYRC